MIRLIEQKKTKTKDFDREPAIYIVGNNCRRTIKEA